jgi:hypothetical protein
MLFEPLTLEPLTLEPSPSVMLSAVGANADDCRLNSLLSECGKLPSSF